MTDFDKSDERVPKRIVLLCWEFLGYHTRQGLALSKRPEMLYRGLKAAGYDVLVITRDHYDGFIQQHGDVILIPGRDTKPSVSYPWARKIQTLVVSARYGDRSYHWAYAALEVIKKREIIRASDLVISFFTPRGPLLLANKVHKLYGCNFIADLQDTWDEGLSPLLKVVGRRWFSKMLRSASAVVQVSPEWAERDSSQLKVRIETIRHAIMEAKSILPRPLKKPLRLIYYGSLDLTNQIHNFFFQAICESDCVNFAYAGSESTDNFFSKRIPSDRYEYLGWLSPDQLTQTLERSDFAVVFGYNTPERKVVPTKCYELIAWQFPFIVVGNDSGGIASLERELSINFTHVVSKSDFFRFVADPKSQQPGPVVFNGLSEKAMTEKYQMIIRRSSQTAN